MNFIKSKPVQFFTVFTFLFLIAKFSEAQIRPSIGNILISRYQGNRLKGFYGSKFKVSQVDKQTLQESFVIDYCFIEKFTNMLEDPQKDYNGFRIVFGTDENDANKQKMFLVPTKQIGSQDHVNQWDTPPNANLCNFKNFSVIGSQVAQNQEGRFSSFHRGDNTANPRNNLTKSVFFLKEIMQFIRDTIKNDPTRQLVDIRIFNASYINYIDNDPVSALKKYGQISKVQSTVLIVFRRKNPRTGVIEDYWQFNESLLLQKIREVPNFVRDVLNHGSLCPNQCN